MPQDVAGDLKRGPILQEMESIRVAHAMRALLWDAETAFASRRLKGFRNGSGFQQAYRSTHSQKDPPIRCGWRRSLQVLHHRGHDLIVSGIPKLRRFCVGGRRLHS